LNDFGEFIATRTAPIADVAPDEANNLFSSFFPAPVSVHHRLQPSMARAGSIRRRNAYKGFIVIGD